MRAIRRFLNNGTKQETRRKPPKLEESMEDLQEAIKKMKERKKLVENDAGEAVL